LLDDASCVLQEFNSEPAIPIYSGRPDHAVQALKHVYKAALNKLKGKELELLLVILPDNNGPLYGEAALSLAPSDSLCRMYFLLILLNLPFLIRTDCIFQET
jgi:hypothetical protein